MTTIITPYSKWLYDNTWPCIHDTIHIQNYNLIKPTPEQLKTNNINTKLIDKPLPPWDPEHLDDQDLRGGPQQQQEDSAELDRHQDQADTKGHGHRHRWETNTNATADKTASTEASTAITTDTAAAAKTRLTIPRPQHKSNDTTTKPWNKQHHQAHTIREDTSTTTTAAAIKHRTDTTLQEMTAAKPDYQFLTADQQKNTKTTRRQKNIATTVLVQEHQKRGNLSYWHQDATCSRSPHRQDEHHQDINKPQQQHQCHQGSQVSVPTSTTTTSQKLHTLTSQNESNQQTIHQQHRHDVTP